MAKKTTKKSLVQSIVLDTNVIFTNASIIEKFTNTNLYIPFTVLEEVDKHKKDSTEVGLNARTFNRNLDTLIKSGDMTKGLLLKDRNVTVFVVPDAITNTHKLDLSVADNRILNTAISLLRTNKNLQLMSKDLNLRIKAQTYGVKAVDYEENVQVASPNSHVEIVVPQTSLDIFYSTKHLQVDAKLRPNQYVVLKTATGTSALGRYDEKKKSVVPLLDVSSGIWGIKPKNVEQYFAFDALLNDDIKFVSLIGSAGCGKTLISMAVALHKVLDEGKYEKVSVARPVIPMGNDIGYLPGEMSEKLRPYMQPIYDNVNVLLNSKRDSGCQELIDQGIISIEPLTYIRGRSIAKQFLIIDEAQSLSKHEIKAIVTRAGEGTKVVLTGDVNQIDNPKLDAVSSGLSYATDKFKDEKIAADVTLSKSERSELAALAAKLL